MNTPKDVPEGKKLTKKEEVGAAIVLVIIFCLVGGYAISTTSKDDSVVPNPVATPQPKKHSDIEAFVDAQSVVTKTLKAPSTAKYPFSSEATIEHVGTDGFKVSSYVDSQNGFGAMIRSNWTVLFQYLPNGNLDIYQVIVDGQEVYRKPGK